MATLKIIIAPVHNYNGISAGVIFTDGKGYTENPYLIEWFKNKGYTIIDPEAESAAPEATNQEESPAVPEAPVQEEPPEYPEAPLGDEPPATLEATKKAELHIESETPEGAKLPEESQDSAVTDPPAAPSPLLKMTLAQLTEYAAANNIDISGLKAKSNILSKLLEAEKGAQ